MCLYLSWIDLVCTCLWRLTIYMLTQMKMKPFQKLYLKHQHDITSPLCVILCHDLLNNQKPQAMSKIIYHKLKGMLWPKNTQNLGLFPVSKLTKIASLTSKQTTLQSFITGLLYLFDKPPWLLLKFWTLRVGAYSRLGTYYIFTIFSKRSMFILQQNNKINGNKTRRRNKEGFCKILWRKVRL